MGKPDWAIKEPRSSRICYRCGHKHASHISERCLKILSRKPKREECSCRGFVSNEDDMRFRIARKKNRIRLLKEALFQAENAEHTHPENTLKTPMTTVN